MSDGPFSDWKLTEYIGVDAEHLHALGAISLLYNVLESSLLHLMNLYMRLGPAGEAVFDRLSNHQRLELLDILCAQREKDPLVSEAIGYARRHFSICTENRNTIAHAIHYGSERSPELFSRLMMRKKSSDKSKDNLYSFDAKTLRSVADDIQQTIWYVVGIVSFLYQRNEGGIPGVTRDALPDRPPQPNSLRPLQTAFSPESKKRQP